MSWRSFTAFLIFCPFALPFAIKSLSTRSVHASATCTRTSLFSTIESPVANTENVMDCLFGSAKAREAFFQNDFGFNVVHFARTDSDLESPLAQVRMEDLYDTSNYTTLRRRGSLDYVNKTEMSFDDFSVYIRGGGSAVVPIAEEGNAMLPFKESIEESLQRETSMNVYHSGPRGVALNRHYDAYDVLVLQIDGEKEWEILRDNVTWTNTTMVPGDLLYIPRGIYHAATTAAGFDSTTHVTIGLL